MNYLNNDLILELKELHAEIESEVPLYMVNLGTSFVLTDNALLLEWPADHVDRNSTQVAKLTRAASHVLSKRRQLLRGDWRQVTEGKQQENVDSIRVEEGHRVINCLGEDVYFDAFRFMMIHSCIKEPYFRIVGSTHVLCIYDGKRQLCGALAHCLKPLAVDRKKKKALVAEREILSLEGE